MNYLVSLKNEEKILSDLEMLLLSREKQFKEINKFASQVEPHYEILEYFFEANNMSFRIGNFLNVEEAIKVMDSNYWNKVINEIGVLEFMSAKERNAWHDNIQKRKAPEFTKENVIPTIKSLISSRGDFFARKVDGIFNALSGTHVTNNPGAFNTRMIFNLIGSYGLVESNKCEFLNDLRSVIFQILGREKRNFHTYMDISRIQNTKEFGKWLEFDSGALKLKIYKKGTAHLEVHPSIAMQLNQILSKIYPQAIAPLKKNQEKIYKKFELSNDYLKLETLNDLADLRFRNNNAYYNEYNDEVIKVLKAIGGIYFDNYFTFSYNPEKVIAEIIRMGYIPNKQSHQFYPTEEALSDMAVSHLMLFSDYYTLLEPSAGIGNLVDKVKARNIDITCVEISAVNAKVLESKGYKVENMDFMDYPVSNKFSRILMNPPFTKGQAKAHLEKAIKHLEEEGVLVAILPSSMKSYQNKNLEISVSDVFSGAFEESGTNVSVILMTIKKR